MHSSCSPTPDLRKTTERPRLRPPAGVEARQVARGALTLTEFGPLRPSLGLFQAVLDRANQTLRRALMRGGPEAALTDAECAEALRELNRFFPAAADMMRDVLVRRLRRDGPRITVERPVVG